MTAGRGEQEGNQCSEAGVEDGGVTVGVTVGS